MKIKIQSVVEFIKTKAADVKTMIKSSIKNWKNADRKTIIRSIGVITVIVAFAILAVIVAVLKAKSVSKTPVDMDGAKVELNDYKNIELTLPSLTVTDEDVDNYAKSLLNYYNTYSKQDKEIIERGDTVAVTMYVCDTNGNVIGDEGTQEIYINVGSGRPYAEVDNALIGAKPDSSLEIPVTLSSGEQGVAYVTAKHVLVDKVSYDTLTDTQADAVMSMSGVEGYEGVDGFYAYIRDLLDSQNKNTTRTAAYNAICEHLLETCTVDPFPDLELKKRMTEYMESVTAMCSSYYNMTFAEYCNAIGKTEKEYKTEIEKSLRDEIKSQLILMAIGDAENIQYDEDEFDTWSEDVLSDYGYDSMDDFYAEYGEENIKDAYRIEYIVDWLIDNGHVTYTDPE